METVLFISFPSDFQFPEVPSSQSPGKLYPSDRKLLPQIFVVKGGA